MDKNKPQTILHLNRDLEDLYHEYSVFRYDVIPLRRVSSIKISEMKMLSKELNENEEKVMRAWERNLKTTKMPLITYNESSKTCGADMRYRK
ncbi:MAG TPA: hypothetical protein DHV17_07940 [Chitinophagaceae bacterium]|nr:hypothetical protein [Chitinophagaceae bacterium]